MSVSLADPIQSALDTINRKRWLTTVGLNPAALPAMLTPAEHTALATYLGTLDDLGAWGRGDQVVIVQNEVRKIAKNWTQQQYGEAIQARYAELMKLYRSIELKTLLNNASTARTWPHNERRQTSTLGYGHHEALNSRSPEEREYYLDMAEAAGWTVSQLRAELFGGRRNVTPGACVANPAAITDLFRLLDMPISIEPNRCTFSTAQGRITVESNSELIWRIEQ